jgi:two-component system, NtrC family, sensor kinase
MKCPRCEHHNPSRAKFCLECGAPFEPSEESGFPPASYRQLERALTQAHQQLKEALERETATGEILRVISRSPTDIQPVFDAVAESAARLCEAFDSSIWRRDGDWFKLVAHHGSISQDISLPVVRGTAGGRAVLERRTILVNDMQTEETEFPESRELAQRLGFRTLLCVPLIRKGVAIGVITLRRTETKLFTDRQVALLQTFADQAVIAIENVGLFKELEARNRDLTQALDQQTATAEVLAVVGSSPTDVQPVFDAIVESARRLLGGFSSGVFRLVGDEIHLAALTSTTPSGDTALRRAFPRPLSHFSTAGEAIRTRTPVVLTDLETDPRIPDDFRKSMRERAFRSGVWVPMLREGVAIGAIGVTRSEAGGFGGEEIALLKTFADQAVIAIENVRAVQGT